MLIFKISPRSALTTTCIMIRDGGMRKYWSGMPACHLAKGLACLCQVGHADDYEYENPGGEQFA